MFDTLKKFFAFCPPENRKKFHLSIALGVLAGLFSALKIPAIGVMLRAIVGDGMTVSAIVQSLVLMLVSILGTSLVKYQSTMLQTEAGYGTAADKRMEIAEHMRYLPMGYFNENSLGSILSVTTNTMENLSDVGTRVVMIVFEGIITTLVITLCVFLFDWRPGLLILAGLVLYYLANALLRHRARTYSAEKVRSDTALVEKVLEYICGMAEVKAYHLSGRYNQRVEQAVSANEQANIRMETALVPFMALQNFVAKLTGVGVAVLSIALYTAGTMSLLHCLMMLVCSFLLLEALELAGNYSTLLRVVDLSVDKANAILRLPPMDIDGEDIAPASYDLAADHIRFAYENKTIISDLSVKIPQHTTTAIVGPSGGGKTTLCHLLSRFWDVDEGTVTLGGRDVRSYSMDALMRNFSFVFQNVYLFRDTIANNIRFGQPEAPMEKVIEAAKKAKCDAFIRALPDGYDTVIGESGSTLSGGERQRLSIARAMLKDAPIVILDEATANVDPENEQDLLEAIEALTHDKTILLIAHRMKTVQHADRILVIDHGRIVEQGTHEELLAQNGIYSRFIGQRRQAAGWKLSGTDPV